MSKKNRNFAAKMKAIIFASNFSKSLFSQQNNFCKS